MILICVLVLFWLAAGHRLVVLARRPNAVNVSYATAAAGVAAAVTVKTWQSGFDRLTGPYVSDVVLHVFIIVGGLGSQMFLLTLRAAEPARREVVMRLAVAALATAAMICAFVAAPIHMAVTGGLDEQYGDFASIAVYRVILNAYLAFVLLDIVQLCRRYADRRDDVSRSVGLTFVGWGCGIGLGYAVSRLLYAVLDPVVLGRPLWLLDIGRWSALISLSALAAGVLTPWWMPSFLAWREARLGASRVSELWQDLATVFPSVVLETGRPWTARRAQLRYDRYLIEIAECLARASLTEDARLQLNLTQAVDGLAIALRQSQRAWATGAGLKAAAALPPVTTRESEEKLLLALASAYARSGVNGAAEGARSC